MRRRGFWDHFFDSDHRQRGDINTALDSVEHQQQYIGLLEHNMQQLQTKVMQLGMTVDVLLDLLEEHKLIDERELDRRVNERLYPPPPPPPPQSAGSPYRDGGAVAEAPRPVATTTCLRCSSVVPVTSTQITETGTVCDRCFSTMR
jgi:hypothetical protein